MLKKERDKKISSIISFLDYSLDERFSKNRRASEELIASKLCSLMDILRWDLDERLKEVVENERENDLSLCISIARLSLVIESMSEAKEATFEEMHKKALIIKDSLSILDTLVGDIHSRKYLEEAS